MVKQTGNVNINYLLIQMFRIMCVHITAYILIYVHVYVNMQHLSQHENGLQ